MFAFESIAEAAIDSLSLVAFHKATSTLYVPSFVKREVFSSSFLSSSSFGVSGVGSTFVRPSNFNCNLAIAPLELPP